MLQYDYIIAGGGLAGLYTAIRAAHYGRVAIVTKEHIEESNSYFAQGGIAAVMASDDSSSLHKADTIEAGRGLCNKEAVETLCNEAPERICELIEMGIEFDREADGSLALGLEGGHHKNRILHAGGDETGRVITSFMINEVLRSKQIDIYTNHRALRLLINQDGCYGLVAWDFKQGVERSFIAPHTVMSTGGAAALYSRSTNPHGTLGDGIAICYKAGCEVRDMEFVQFHPTALYTSTGEAFLISEAVRGEGARLYNSRGDRFMLRTHEMGELAPRDIVARTIFEEMNLVGEAYVYLSNAHLPKKELLRRFPSLAKKVALLGYDFSDRIPVAPAAHYVVGGVSTDLYGRTSIPHLYAVGELASTGIMGANRLASNSLIECLTFGYRAIENSRKLPSRMLPSQEICPRIKTATNQESFGAVKTALAELMMQNVGIIRNMQGLHKAQTQISELRHLIDPHDGDLYSLKAMQLLLVADLITTGAIRRRESRGGHYRSDYPKTNDTSFCRHTVQQINSK